MVSQTFFWEVKAMRRSRWLASSLVVALLVGGTTLVARQGSVESAKEGKQHKWQRKAKEPGQAQLALMEKELNLTVDQKAKIKEKLQAKAKALAEIRKLIAQYDREIYNLLTVEQQRTWNGVKTYQKLSHRFKRLKLSDEQDAKIKSICKQAAAKATETTRKAKRALYRSCMQTIRDEVLTAEQCKMLPTPKVEKKKQEQKR